MENNNNNNNNILSVNELPPGFRFDPSDEELVLHFLYSKCIDPTLISNNNFIPIFEDFYTNYHHPTQLFNGEAFESYGKWYFYARKCENLVNVNGYWIDMGMDHPIYARSSSNKLIGMKKTLMFYKGMFPSGIQTGWFIQEFHLCTNDLARKKGRLPHKEMDKWVLCRAQQTWENWEQFTNKLVNEENEDEELSYVDEVFVALAHENDDITSPYY